MRRKFLHILLQIIPCILLGCQENHPPELQPLKPQIGFVGSSLDIELTAHDIDADELTFGFNCSSLKIANRYKIQVYGNDALFQWTPNGKDVGEHEVSFIVSDGEFMDIQTVQITIKPSSNSQPVFREPLGDGNTYSMVEGQCIEFIISVQDPDTLDVDIRLETATTGANVVNGGENKAKFYWCPTEAQIQQQVHTMKFIADDHDNPPVYKSFTIILSSS